MITLYQFEISPFCDKVRRVLHYKGVDYQVKEVPILDAPLGYRRVNVAPRGRATRSICISGARLASPGSARTVNRRWRGPCTRGGVPDPRATSVS